MDSLTSAPTPTSTPSAADGLRLGLHRATLGRPGAVVLDNVELEVRPGELLTVVGPSGCGKSTLLRTLAGLLPVLDGSASADGQPITGPSADRALVFQEDGLLPWRSVRGNVELPLAIQGVGRPDRRSRATGWLERVGLPGRERELPQRLSGGQRQRVQLARALVGAPRAVLMDEPFGALDARTRAEMQQLLVGVLGRTRATVVFVTHDVDEALFLGDRVALLGGGSVRTLDVPGPRDQETRTAPETVRLREEIIDSLHTS